MSKLKKVACIIVTIPFLPMVLFGMALINTLDYLIERNYD